MLTKKRSSPVTAQKGAQDLIKENKTQIAKALTIIAHYRIDTAKTNS